MTDIVDAYRLMWLPWLVGIRRKPRHGLQRWLSTGTFQINFDSIKLEVVLSSIDRHEVAECMAYDINRLSLAGSESLHNVRSINGLPKSSAWPLVMLYYSTLFYVHALMRIWGVSISYLNGSDLIGFRRLGGLYNIPEVAKFAAGQRRIVVDARTSEVRISKIETGEGSHEALWRYFAEELNNLDVRVDSSPLLTADKASLKSEISHIRSALTRAGKNNIWLSGFRNNMQYRQEYGIWYPYSANLRVDHIQSRLDSLLASTVSVAKYDVNNTSDLKAFEESCLAIIHSVRATLNALFEISGQSSFLKYGMVGFERHIRA